MCSYMHDWAQHARLMPRALDSLELELAAKLVPGMKPRSSAGAAHALKSWSVSLQPHKQIFTPKILCFVLYLYSLKDLNMLFKEQEKTKKHFQKKNQGSPRTSSPSQLTHVRL